MLKKLLIGLLYCLYGLVLVTVLLLVFFPKERFVVWLEEQVEARMPGYEFRIGGVRYVHPLKIGFDQVVLANQGERIVIPIDRLVAGVDKAWPLERFKLRVELYGGVVQSEVRNHRHMQKFDLINLSVSSIRLESLAFLQKRIDRPIAGSCNYSGDMTVTLGSNVAFQTSGVAEIGSFTTRLRRPILGEKEIELDRITGRVVMAGNTVDVSDGTFSGPLLEGHFSGTVMLAKPWEQSTLDFITGVTPGDSLLKSDPQVAEMAAALYRQYREEAIPGVIEGNIQEPIYRFGNKIKSPITGVQ